MKIYNEDSAENYRRESICTKQKRNHLFRSQYEYLATCLSKRIGHREIITRSGDSVSVRIDDLISVS